ncbi:MAG: hypothetical protein WDM86_18800 [Rhizomicrobium sp.]
MAMTTSRQIKRGLKAVSEHSFVLAADLGQSADPTAIAVMERVVTSHVYYSGQETAAGETFDVRYLRRLPLGLSYVDQVQEMARLLGRPPLSEGCEFVIDATGVGRPVADLWDHGGHKPIRVTITGGDRQSARGVRNWHVPKQTLISALDARLHSGQLRFAADLAEAGAMADELKNFRRSVSAAGRYSYDARVGKHDDLVLAVALALWVFVGKPKYQTASVGKYSLT